MYTVSGKNIGTPITALFICTVNTPEALEAPLANQLPVTGPSVDVQTNFTANNVCCLCGTAKRLLERL